MMHSEDDDERTSVKSLLIIRDVRVHPKSYFYRQLFIDTVCSTLLFAVYISTESLQSSINADGGLGFAVLAVIYTGVIFSSLVMGPVMVSMVGAKWTMVSAMVSYILFIYSNMFGTYSAMIPAAVYMGLSAGTFEVAQKSYLVQLARAFAEDHHPGGEDLVIGQFYGWYFGVFMTCGIYGNLVSSALLEQTVEPSPLDDSQVDVYCGSNFCPGVFQQLNITNQHLDRPPRDQIYTLFSIYTSGGALAMLLMAIFLDDLSVQRTKRDVRSVFDQLATTIRQTTNRKQLAIVPLTLALGISTGFTIGDFTQAYVTCSWGVHAVGYLMITVGATSSLGSLLPTNIAKFCSRQLLLGITVLIQIGVYLTMYFWVPSEDEKVVYFVIAIFEGLCNGIINAIIHTFCGVAFKNNPSAAFAVFGAWKSVGNAVLYSVGNSLCVYVKLVVAFTSMCLGFGFYVLAEWLHTKDCLA